MFIFLKKSSLRDRLHQYQQLNKEMIACLDEFKFVPETDIILMLGDLNLNARCAKYPKDFVDGFPENVTKLDFIFSILKNNQLSFLKYL